MQCQDWAQNLVRQEQPQDTLHARSTGLMLTREPYRTVEWVDFPYGKGHSIPSVNLQHQLAQPPHGKILSCAVKSTAIYTRKIGRAPGLEQRDTDPLRHCHFRATDRWLAQTPCASSCQCRVSQIQ